jgi:hypothetical protein
MGLDIVELALRTEHVFSLTLPDDELTTLRTVGEFYALLCRHLGVIPDPHPHADLGIDWQP